MTAVSLDAAPAAAGPDPVPSGPMPGWSIVADLTPPELLEARSLRLLKRLVGLGLLLVLASCVAGYVLAMRSAGSAQDRLDAASADTTRLEAQAASYSGVTRIQNASAGIRNQVASVMRSDIDTGALAAKLRAALPPSMAIQNFTISLTGSSANQSTTTGAATGAGGLDMSGRAKIGTVTVTGVGHSIDDLPTYVDRLNRLTGVTNVVPATNQHNASSTQFSLTLDLTDALLSNRYASSAGTPATAQAVAPSGGTK